LRFGNKCVLRFSPCFKATAGNTWKTRSLAFQSLAITVVRAIFHSFEAQKAFQNAVITKSTSLTGLLGREKFAL
jgi:hypothetical protein